MHEDLPNRTSRRPAAPAAEKLDGLLRMTGGIARDLDELLSDILENAESSLAHLACAAPLRTRQERIVKASRHAAELARRLADQACRAREDLEDELASGSQCELPLTHRVEEQRTASASTRRSLTPPRTILVVDRDPGVRRLASTMLTRAGYRVRAVASGREALAALWRHTDEISTVLLDLSLSAAGAESEIDGESTFLQLRELRPDLPVVFCSGHGSAIGTRLLRDRERVAFAPKPFRLEDLTRKLRQAEAG